MSLTLREFSNLIRLNQWYKNTVIFISLIFSLKFFQPYAFISIVLGFLSLSLVSSSSYILNDLKDLEKDKKHPEKKDRPLASGKVSTTFAIAISIVLLLLGTGLAFYLSQTFSYFVMLLFAFSQMYTLVFRNIAFLDIMVISINFVIRAISGIFLLNVEFSHWIMLSTFFLSVFLVSGKRAAELKIKSLEKYRSCYSKEDDRPLIFLSTLSITSVVIFFCTYSILYDKSGLLLSLPVALYLLMTYARHSNMRSSFARNPERFILNIKTIIGILVWATILVISLYFL